MINYQIPEIITDDFIKTFYFKNNKCLQSRLNIKILSRYPNLKNYIYNRYNDSSCMSETLYRIYYGVENIPKCPICGKNCKWRGRNNYTTHCSSNCAYKDKNIINKRSNTIKNKTPEEKQKTKEKVQQTCLERYGVKSYTLTNEFKEKYTSTMYKKYGVKYFSQSKEIKEKIKQTNLKNLGVEWPGQNYNCILKGQQTCFERYGVNHNFKIPEVIEKRNKTWKEKYGCENPLGNKEIIEKSKQTKLEKYGDINYNNREKCKETCIKKYGVEHVFQSSEFILHAQQVMYEKYGNICYPMSPVYQDFLLNNYGVKYYSQTEEWRNKSYNTYKINHSFNTSKIEEQFKEYLEQNYPNDFEYQYRSELYPFNCDFYIKSLDLYIEIQGSWVHGGHPFDENNKDDINRLNKMKSKNTQYYNNAINVWTKRDVEKRNIAKQNNLNYLEVFSIDLNIIINKLNNFILYGN